MGFLFYSEPLPPPLSGAGEDRDHVKKEERYEQANDDQTAVKGKPDGKQPPQMIKYLEEIMKPFTFYDIYYAPIKEMDDKQAGRFFCMICDFFDGKEVLVDAESDEEVSPEFELYWESILGDPETYRKSAGKSSWLDKRYKHFPFLSFYRKAFAYLSDSEGGALQVIALSIIL